MTAFCVGPAPVALPGSAGALVPLAAATAGGSLELAVVQQGALLPLHLCISVSLAAHPGPVQGLRWLGSTARLVSYSCEKASGGWRNTLLVTGECWLAGWLLVVHRQGRLQQPRCSCVAPLPEHGLRCT